MIDMIECRINDAGDRVVRLRTTANRSTSVSGRRVREGEEIVFERRVTSCPPGRNIERAEKYLRSASGRSGGPWGWGGYTLRQLRKALRIAAGR